MTVSTMRRERGRSMRSARLKRPELSKRNRFTRRFMSTAALLVFLVFWEVYVRLTNTPAFLLPPPSAVVLEVINSWPKLFPNAVQTIGEVAVGYGASAIIAITLGILISVSDMLERAIMPLLVATDAIPKIAIAPLLLIWFGTGATSKVVLVSLVTFFPILITTITGMGSADRSLITMFRSVGSSRWDEIVKLRLPYAVPYIFTGLKVATTLSVIGAVIAEWVSSSAGLGYLIISGITNFETTLVFASILILVVISLSFYNAVSYIGKRLSWQRDATVTTTDR